MIDYLLCYDIEGDCPKAPEPGVPCWTDEDGRTFMPVSVFKETPSDDPEEPPNVESAPGHWIAVAVDHPSDEVWETMPAVHEVDRETGEVLRTRLSPEQIAYGWQVSPVFAGSDYAFG